MNSSLANGADAPRPTAPAALLPNGPSPVGPSGTRKTAILLTALDGQTAAGILRQLSEREVHDVIAAIGDLRNVTDAERQTVLNEYVAKVADAGTFAPGGAEFATSVVIAAFGQETGKKLADRALKSIAGDEPKPVDVVRSAEPRRVATMLGQENPQTTALLLAHVGPESAARVLAHLPTALRLEVTKRIAALDEISPEVVNRIATIVGGKLRVAGGVSTEPYAGARAAADMLNRVDASTRDELLRGIGDQDGALGARIRNFMFVFDDFQKVGKESMRTLLAKVDKKLLTVALKGASPAVKAHYMSVMSKGAVEMLTEDMQALGPVRIKDVEEAQLKVIESARQLEATGEISLASDSDEQYVD